MGTVSEIQHRQKIIIWIEDKNNFNYYLAEESFLNCFTNVDVEYRCLSNELSCDIKHFDESANNILLIPLHKEESLKSAIEDVSDQVIYFAINFSVPIIIGAGHLNLTKIDFDTAIPNKYCKIFCNDNELEDERLIKISTYPVKLYNFYGPTFIKNKKFDILKKFKYDSIVDDREWWDIEEMELAPIVKITNRDHIWKALMIGQPFTCDFDHNYDLKTMGFKEYPWINEKVDEMFIRKNSYFINKHNKENFDKIVENNNNYAFFAKQVFTF